MPAAIERTTPQDFRLFLQEELVNRCRTNPRYSLRAFARSLSISPSALSDMLHGKRPITARTRQKLGPLLGLRLDETESLPATPTATFQQITLDTFAIISDWYHYAILELMKCPGFQPNPAWIARALGISRHEAAAAIERLERVGIVERDQQGGWRDTSGGFSTNIEGNLSSIASRRLQRQVLEMSIRALEELSPEQRNHSSMTMAIDPALLPEAINRIREFRRSLCEFLESGEKPKEVFQLGISLYPLTQLKGRSS